MTPPLVIAVAYASDDHLNHALSLLDPALHDGALRMVVVDNGASTATEQMVARHGARYVRAPRNLGFAGGVNLGVRTEWDGVRDVLLLNPDARVTPDQISRLQRTLHAQPRTAAVGPLLMGADGVPQRASWPMPSPAQVWWEALGLGRLWSGRCFITGAVLLINGAAMAAVGPFDERYFLYAEETDWQLRAIRDGWTVRVDDQVQVRHVGGASSSDAEARLRTFHTSGRAFADRWYGPVGSLIFRLGRVAGACRRWLVQPASRAEQRIVLATYLAPSRRDK